MYFPNLRCCQSKTPQIHRSLQVPNCINPNCPYLVKRHVHELCIKANRGESDGKRLERKHTARQNHASSNDRFACASNSHKTLCKKNTRTTAHRKLQTPPMRTLIQHLARMPHTYFNIHKRHSQTYRPQTTMTPEPSCNDQSVQHIQKYSATVWSPNVCKKNMLQHHACDC